MAGQEEVEQGITNPFKFIVGLKEREFVIDASLFAKASPVLNNLINGDSPLTRSGCVKWPEVDEFTFSKFSQFCYTGDYETPMAINEGAQDSVDDQERSLVDELGIRLGAIPWSESTSSSLSPVPSLELMRLRRAISDRKRANDNTWWEITPAEIDNLQMNRLWLKFRDTKVYHTASQASSSSSSNFIAQEHTNPFESYSEILLTHAKLYILADDYQVKPLMDQSLHKLHCSLVAFTPFDRRIPDIIDLLKCCFAEPTPTKLRELVSVYAACRTEQLWVNQDFKDLMHFHGDLSVGLMSAMLARG